MGMSEIRRIALALAGLSLTCACDLEASPDYLGESLLSLQGKVTISDDRTEGALVPALAFENADDGRLDIVDVEVEGEFPNSFSLDVYTPPPNSALMEGPPGEARFAIGFVTAVSARHEPFIRYANGASGGGGECDEEACYEEYETCTNDGSECYRETRRCDLDLENCVVIEMSGDPSIRDDPWKSFAGLSRDYRVLYLSEALSAESEMAKLFAGGEPLAQGYHLLTVREQTAAEDDAGDACFARAEREVLKEYNEAHGTEYENFDMPGCPDDGTPCDQISSKELEALWEALDERVSELGCQRHSQVYARVAHPESTFLTIHIAPDVGPLAYQEPAP
jgi:hypothetical protein